MQDSLFTLQLLQEPNKAPDSWFELKVNTHVYVNGLPDDVTAEEVSQIHFLRLYDSLSYEGFHLILNLQVVEVFSKCGLIKEVVCILFSNFLVLFMVMWYLFPLLLWHSDFV